MRRTIRTETKIETDEILIVRRQERTLAVVCPDCPTPVRMLSPAEIAALASVSIGDVSSWVENRKGHSRKTPDGAWFICPRAFCCDP